MFLAVSLLSGTLNGCSVNSIYKQNFYPKRVIKEGDECLSNSFRSNR